MATFVVHSPSALAQETTPLPLVLLVLEEGPLDQLEATRATQLRAAVAIAFANQGWRSFSAPAPEGETPAEQRQAAIASAWAVNARVALWLGQVAGQGTDQEPSYFLRVVSRTNPEGRVAFLPAGLEQIGENFLARLAVDAVVEEYPEPRPRPAPQPRVSRPAGPRRAAASIPPAPPWNDARPLVLLMMDSGLLQSVDLQRANEFRTSLAVSLAQQGLRTFTMNAPSGHHAGLRRAAALEAVLDAGAMAALWVDAEPHQGEDLETVLRAVSWHYPRGRRVPLPLSIDEMAPPVFSALARDLLGQVVTWSTDASPSWAPAAGTVLAEVDECQEWSPQPKAD